MGPTSSGITLNILDEVRRRGVLVCSGSNTSAELSTTDSGGYYFRTTPSDRLQGPALGRLVLKDGRKKVGILARRDTYGIGLARSVKQTLENGHAKVVADVSYDPDATSFDREVQRVIDKKPDAVVVLGFESDGSDIVRTLSAKGLSPQQFPIYTADGMRTNAFPTLLDPNNPAAAAGIKGTSPATQPAGVQHPFLDAFNATGIDPIYSSFYYDCTTLTALAAEKAKSDDPAKMKKVFAANTKGKEQCTTFADCKRLLDTGKTISYQGASAAFKHMNKFGTFEPNAGVYEVWAFDATGRDVTAPPETQIRIG
jgi:ABC-type branched-subunit amino acid transport system substrate-binding protein